MCQGEGCKEVAKPAMAEGENPSGGKICAGEGIRSSSQRDAQGLIPARTSNAASTREGFAQAPSPMGDP